MALFIAFMLIISVNIIYVNSQQFEDTELEWAGIAWSYFDLGTGLDLDLEFLELAIIGVASLTGIWKDI